MAALLKRQKPIGRAVSVWCPGGRVATNAFDALPAITSSTASLAPPTARKAASKLPGDIADCLDVVRRMAKRDNVERPAWRLDACQRLKLFIFQGLLDRAQPVRPLRVAGRREVVQAGGMTEQKRGHCLDLNAPVAGRKCLSRFCVQADAVGRPAAVGYEKIDLQRLTRIDTVLVEICHAFPCEKGVV